MRMLAWLLVALLTVACGDDSPTRPTPVTITAPTTTPTPTPAPDPTPDPTRPVDGRFIDTFWQEMIFNRYDLPGNDYVVYVLETTSPNFYIRLGDENGRQVVPDYDETYMRNTIPYATESLTGRRYRGRLESGLSDPGERPGWIVVKIATGEEEPEVDGYCAATLVGTLPGEIIINRNCTGEEFPGIFLHELGHAMGFYHVSDRNTVMASSVFDNRVTYTGKEKYHARLAYEVGRYATYCGWPYSAACFTRSATRVGSGQQRRYVKD